MKIGEYLEGLGKLGIRVWIEKDDIYCDGPKGVINSKILNELKRKKKEVFDFLKKIGAVSYSRFSPITAAPKQEVYPLSLAQERLWILELIEPNNSVYNFPSSFRFQGSLSIPALEKALNTLIERHASLRTSFIKKDGTPHQIIRDNLTISIPVIELTALPEDAREEEARRIAAQEANTPFDLIKSPLFRTKLIKLHDHDYVFLLNMHHIISDGWSHGIFWNEFGMLYNTYLEGKENPLTPLKIQYLDYAVWQRQQIRGDIFKAQEDYWKEKFQGGIPTLNLPTDRPRPPTMTYKGAVESITLSKDLTHKLKDFSLKHNSTLFMTLLSAFNILLSRYSGQDDIVVGSFVANRHHNDTEPIVGFFVNTLALRTNLQGNPIFSELLNQVRTNTLDAYGHQDYPFEQLVEVLNPPRDMSRTPLFQAALSFQNDPFSFPPLKNLSLDFFHKKFQTSKFDLTVFSWAAGENLTLCFEYYTNIFTVSTIRRMMKHFQTLLGSIVSNPNQRIEDLKLLTEDEASHILLDFNKTDKGYPQDKTIHELFEEQVKRTPKNVALVFDDKSLTYEELNTKANQLAHYLREEKGIKPDDLVAICMDRSLEMIIAILAVLKSGGAYLPIDPQYPKDRILYMLEDSKAPVLLTQAHLAKVLPQNTQAHWVFVDSDWKSFISSHPTTNLPNLTHPYNLAYSIYTSGSTGKPKGSLIRHGSVINRINWMQRAYPLNGTDVILQKTTYTFDVSVWELFWWFFAGAKLSLLSPQGEKDPQVIIDAIDKHAVTTLHFVPSMLNIFLEEIAKNPSLISKLKTLKHSFVSGEALPPVSVKRFYGFLTQNHTRLYNLYGPTEVTVDVSYYNAQPEDKDKLSIPIGKPIDNTQLYILDSNLKSVPIGVPGELHIGGVGLARGYLNRTDLTAEKFIPNPFSQEEGERLYKTGDLARYLPDGNIEFLGRIDFQVKIRGFRIELGEIESNLREHSAIQESVVLAKEDPNAPTTKYLIAYLIPKDPNTKPSTTKLRDFLKNYLPAHMIPSHFIYLDKLPLTPNGKVDRKALPLPDNLRPELGHEYAPPRTSEEEILCNIWQEVLHVDRVGIHDNFFELGGHSLLATQVINRIRTSFSTDIPFKTLFEHSTIAQLSPELGKGTQPLPPILPTPKQSKYPLSFAQQRLWFLNQLEPESPFYNVHGSFRLQGALSIPILEKTLNTLIERHSSFRTSLIQEGGTPYQVIRDKLAFSIPITDLTSSPENKREEEARRIAEKDAHTLFDLTKSPLLRVQLIKLHENDYVFFFNMHHIISDGWSQGIFLNEFGMLYNAYLEGKENPLTPLKIQYLDYAAWQREQITGEILKIQEDYWKSRFQGELPTLNLPTDRPRPPAMTYKGAVESITLSKDLTYKLKDFSLKHNSTLFMILLSAFNILLSRYSGQDDIVIGSPIANRHYSDTEPIIGFFVNTIALRTNLEGNPTFLELLNQVRTNTLDAYRHQDYPFEQLVEALNPPRDMSRSPIYQTMLAFQNAPSFDVSLKNISLNAFERELRITRVDLITYAWESNDHLALAFEYYSDIFSLSTIQEMMKRFQVLLESIASNPNQRIKDLKLLTQEEERRILIDLNQTDKDYPKDKTIHELFEAQVKKTPKHTAVVFEDASLTYEELNAKANQLAHYLRQEKEIRPDDLVAICMDKSLEMIIAIMGILKAGGAYLPIDPQWPVERIKSILNSSDANFVLTSSFVTKALPYVQLQNLHQNFEIATTPPREQIKDFDALPFPDRSLIEQRQYDNFISDGGFKRHVTLQATRGCPYKCAYCHKVWPKAHVFRSAQNIFEEVYFHYKRGYRSFCFIDDVFNLNRKNSEDFFKLIIKNKLKIRLAFPNGLRGDLLTPDYIDHMAAAGTYHVALALETATPRLQKLIRKDLDIEKLRKNIEYITKKHPLIVLGLFTMVGLPTQTKEEALETLNFIKSIRWLHFPYINILTVYPRTDMADIVMKLGVSPETIEKNADLPMHQVGEGIMPFSEGFVREYQAKLMADYILLPERLRYVVPIQKQVFDLDELIAKYDSYLPGGVKNFPGVYKLIKETKVDELRPKSFPAQLYRHEINYAEMIRCQKATPNTPLRVLLIDITQHFSGEATDEIYDLVTQPLGLMYLLTYLNQKFGNKVSGQILRSRIDFDSFEELKKLTSKFNPDLIGIRSTTFSRNYLHQTAELFKSWFKGNIPIVVGGPYATSEHDRILSDKNIDLIVRGEGEHTFAEIVQRIMENNNKIPDDEVLAKIPGIVFIPKDKKKTAAIRYAREIITVDLIPDALSRCFDQNLTNIAHPNNLAYSIYTSGSTGEPKGSNINHQSVCKLMESLHDIIYSCYALPLKIGFVASVVFDASVQQIFSALTLGHSLYIIPDDFKKDGGRLLEYYQKHQIDISDGTPLHIDLLTSNSSLQQLPVKHFIIGGDKLSLDTVKTFYGKTGSDLDIKITNLYGPTECCVDVTSYPIDKTTKPNKTTSIPIGKALSNTKIYILDSNLEPTPIGVPGELHIGGVGLARGYLNRPDFTAEKFIPNPFTQGEGERLYGTGDLARYLSDDNIEFLGRIDFQVKIRGFRIELGEIEYQIQQYNQFQRQYLMKKIDLFDQKNAQTMKVCQRCVLPETYPNIIYDKDGICNVCREYDRYKEKAGRYFKRKDDFQALLKKTKGGGYDCMLLFSGGKDSTYALYRLVEMGLKVFAFTFDNGYISTAALNNIKNVTSALKVDSVISTIDNMNEIFLENLRSESTVCTGCFKVLTTMATKYACVHGINLILTGFSRGQIFDLKLHELFSHGIFDVGRVESNLIQFRKIYHANKDRISRLANAQFSDDVFEKVVFDDYFRYDDSAIDEIKEFLKSKDVIWDQPQDTGFCSSNCTINDLGVCFFTAVKGYHNYASPLSWDIRLGILKRDAALKELNIDLDRKKVSDILNKLFDDADEKINAVVVVQRDALGNESLCAYLVSDQRFPLTEIRSYLANRLPDYMIPAHFIYLSKLPLTSSGKVNRKALPLPDGLRPELENEYIPPRTPEEEMLCSIWKEVLQVDSVGIHDNFFELGGDSIKTIQIVSRAAQKALKFSVRDMFERQTIAALVSALKPVIVYQAEQDIVTGDIPLTPVQHWFFNQSLPESYHYNQSMLLEGREHLKPDLLQQVFEKLLIHHDALRLRFQKQDLSWRQYDHGSEDIEQVFSYQDITRLSEKDQTKAIEETCSRLQASLNLTEGPLVRATLFDLGSSQAQRLFIVIHHLAVDGVSWRVLLEDIQTAYTQLLDNKAIQLPPKTTSFKEWSHKLLEYVQSDKLKQEVSFWLSDNYQKPYLLPLDHSQSKNTNESAADITVFLTPEETKNLLTEVPKAYHTQINDMLLTALALAMSKWTKQDNVLINLEGHGREEIIEQTDLSRTVGWFTSLFPVALTLPRTDKLGEIIKSLKEQLRQIPNKGIGYGILRYLTKDSEFQNKLRSLAHPLISFNYLGQFSDTFQKKNLFQRARESQGKGQSLKGERMYLLEINSSIVHDELHLCFRYSNNFHDRSTIQKFSDDYIQSLKRLINHCLLSDSSGWTPSDFPLVEDKEDLEDLL